MSQTRFRQIARLESQARLYIKRRQEQRNVMRESTRRFAFEHVAALALLILYGDPKIDEPLPNAWQRCLNSKAWKACREKHPDFAEYGRDDEGSPFKPLGIYFTARYFRKYFIPELPGSDEIEKLNAVFKTAPPWFLWFTHADVYGAAFGLKIPDLSSVRRFAREGIVMDRLPEGPFECHPLPTGVEDKFYNSSREGSALYDNLTPRERKRALRINGGAIDHP